MGRWADDGSRYIDHTTELMGSKVQDAGLLTEGLNMAAGATVYGSWVDNVEWVRNVILLVQSDQQYDINLQRRDRTLTASWGIGLNSANTLTGAAWNTISYTGTNGLLGYSARYGIKNSAAVANTFARARAQFLGL